MPRTMFGVKGLQRLIGLLLLLALLPAMPAAADSGPRVVVPAPYMGNVMLSQLPFEAEAYTQVEGEGLPYISHEKIHVSRHRLRRRSLEALGRYDTDVMINDLEREGDYGSYALNTGLKVYWALNTSNIGALLPGDASRQVRPATGRYRWRDSDWQRLGIERIEGVEAVHYRRKEDRRRSQEVRLDIWFTASDGVPVRIVQQTAHRTATTRLTNIRVGAQPAALFEPADDYARVSARQYILWQLGQLRHPDGAAMAGLTGEAAAEAIRASARAMGEVHEMGAVHE